MITADSLPASATPPAAASVVPTKIQSRHGERLAVVYVRQSTAQQVLEHRESTALQYALRSRAINWGWPPDRVLVIDDDQGRSGASAQGREGFQRLLSEVALDHVGLVLGIEMSRLARSCKDWHQLLELCALFGTLLGDQDGVYDPREYNDRLLLGLKGTLSEAELHLLQQRMHQGLLNKARRGELFCHPPLGYVRLPTGGLALDPDQQVQDVVRLVFDRFEDLGTVNALLRFLVNHDVRLPVRLTSGPQKGQVEWRPVRRHVLQNLLHHPIYAGAYTWGRRAVDPRKRIPGRAGTGRRRVPPEQCQVLLKDRCPAYISWERFQVHQQKLLDNQARGHWRGVVREGSALLKGLLICGRCGCRMTVTYPGSTTHDRYARYNCCRRAVTYGESLCQNLAAHGLDDLVAQRVLAVLEPAALELSLSAASDIQRQRQQLDHHWQQRLERSRQEADRAARQYHAVEPENRLVARELERQWEQSLLGLRNLQDAYDRFRQDQPGELRDADGQQIRALAQDIPALWHAAQTTPQDRQTIVRHLIQQIVVTAPKGNPQVEFAIHWAGGFVSRHHLTRPVGRYQHLPEYLQLLARIRELRDQRLTSTQIADQLNREGFRPPRRRTTFSAQIIRILLSRQACHGPRPRSVEAQTLRPHEWWFVDLACHLSIPQPTLYSWLRRGWVHGRQLPGARGRWILWADTDEQERLRHLHTGPRSWCNKPQAADLTRPKPRPVES